MHARSFPWLMADRELKAALNGTLTAHVAAVQRRTALREQQLRFQLFACPAYRPILRPVLPT